MSGEQMHDWNVIITVRERGFVLACELLEEYGKVFKTDFFNVLVMKTDDPHGLMEMLKAQYEANPAIESFLSRLIPVEYTFRFQSAEDFRARLIPIAEQYVSALADKMFYVRMHRRGFKGRISSTEEEQFLDGHLRERLAQAGSKGEIAFDDPDAILSVETIGQDAGVSLWSRDDLERYPFLRFD